jgi:hypothetical protein
LNGEIFYSLKELRVLAERWRVHYNTVRPHSSLGYRPPAPIAWLPKLLRGMEKWKAKNASHFSTPPSTATSHITYPPRYTNNRTGTKLRAGHHVFCILYNFVDETTSKIDLISPLSRFVIDEPNRKYSDLALRMRIP